MKVTSIKKNYLYSVAYQLLVIIVPLITAPYLTRIMGATQLGIYSYTNSVSYYFYLFTMLGIANYGNRIIASVRDDREKLNITFNELIQMQLTFGLAVTIVYCLYLVILVGSNSQYVIPSIIWIPYVISGMLDISWFFWGIEQFSITVLRNTIIKIATTCGIFLFVKNESDLGVYIGLISGGFFLSSFILWCNVKKYVSFIRVSIRNSYKHFKDNILLFIPVVAVSIYTVMDKLMLGNLSPMNELGFYDNIQKIMTLPTGLITALGTVMLPRISNLIANGKRDKALSFIGMSMNFSLFFSVALSFGLAAIAPCFTVVYFGEEFSDTSKMMELFCVTIIFISWANVIRTQYLIPNGNDKGYIVSVIFGAFINVIVNLLLIPSFHSVGAVIGTICAEFSVAAIQTFYAKGDLPISKYICQNLIYLFPGIIMFFMVRFVFYRMGYSILSLLIQILCGAGVYILLGGYILLHSRTILSTQINKTIETISVRIKGKKNE